MAENSLPIQIEISVDEASSNRTYAQIKQKAEQEGRKLGQSLTEGFKLSPRAIEEQIVSTVRQARGGARKEMERLYNDLFRVESAVTSLGTKGAIESRLINEIRQASGSAKSEMERMYADLFKVDSVVTSVGAKGVIESRIINEIKQASGSAKVEIERMYADLFKVESVGRSMPTKGFIESKIVGEIKQASGSARQAIEQMYSDLFRVNSIVKSTSTKNFIESRIQSEINSADRSRLQSMYDGLFGQVTKGSLVRSVGTKNFIESRIVGEIGSIDRSRLQNMYDDLFSKIVPTKTTFSGGSKNLMADMLAGSDDATRRMAILHEQALKMNDGFLRQSEVLSVVQGRLSKIALMTTQATRAFFGLSLALSAVTAPAVFGGAYLKSLEDAQHGIAANLTAMSKAAGGNLSYAESSAIAATSIDRLSKESLKYNISLEDIVKTYQAIIGPGMAAGMTIEQIGRVATIGAVATKSLALDSRQVVQEVRDLVQGGIQASSSTLATSLGLTDKDIKSAKQSTERLFSFLEKRLEGYTISAMERQNTLGGAFDLLKIKVQRLFADDQSYKQFTQFIVGLSNSIAKINDQTKELELNPTLVAVTKDYMAALRGVGTALVDVASLVGKVVGFVFEMNAAMGQIPLASLLAYIIYTKSATLQTGLLKTEITLTTIAANKLTFALSAIGSFLAGYTFGKVLYEQFESVRKSGVWFIEVITQGFNSIVYASREVAAALGFVTDTMRLNVPMKDAIKNYQDASAAAKKSYTYQKELNADWAKSAYVYAERSSAQIIENKEKLSAEELRIQRNQALKESRSDAERYNDKLSKQNKLNNELAKLSSRLLISTSAGATASEKKEAFDLYKRGVEKAKSEYEQSDLKDTQRAEHERLKGIEQSYNREIKLIQQKYEFKNKEIEQATKFGLSEESANAIRGAMVKQQLSENLNVQNSHVALLNSVKGLNSAQQKQRENKITEIQETKKQIEATLVQNNTLKKQHEILSKMNDERKLQSQITSAEQDAAKTLRKMEVEHQAKYVVEDPIKEAGKGAYNTYIESQQGALNKLTDDINAASDAQESLQNLWLAGVISLNELTIGENAHADAVKRLIENRAKLEKSILSGAETIRSRAESYAEEESSLMGGAKQAFKDYSKNAIDAAAMSKQAFANTFKSMEDGIVEFAKTGKLSVGSFVQSVIDGLIRMAAQAAVTNLGQAIGLGGPKSGPGTGSFLATAGNFLSSFFAKGAAFDGIKKYAKGAAFGTMVATSPMTAFANGGIPSLDKYTNSVVSSPTLFKFGQGSTGLMGEKPGSPGEAILPLVRLSGGDLGVKSTSTDSNSNVVVNVVVNVDAGGNSDVQTNGHGIGKGMGDLIGAKVRETILVEQRPGGLLNRSR